MSVRVVITDPPEFDPSDPETVPTSITISGSCRPDDAEVHVRVTAGVDAIFDDDVPVTDGDWTVDVSGLPPGAFVVILARASVGSSFDVDQIFVLVEDGRSRVPTAEQAAARQARRR